MRDWSAVGCTVPMWQREIGNSAMWPFFRMTVPKGVVSLNDVDLKLGVRMFRSYVFLFGVLPVDQLTFQPRMASQLVKWFIHHVFVHRHQVLKANLG